MKNLIAIYLFIILVSCSSSKSKKDLLEGSWQLTSVESLGKPASELFKSTIPFIVFVSADSRVAGSNGCNRFSGTYTSAKSKLNIGALITTKMACDNVDEKIVTDNLPKVTSFSITDEGQTLKLMNDNLVILVFKKQGK